MMPMLGKGRGVDFWGCGVQGSSDYFLAVLSVSVECFKVSFPQGSMAAS